MDLGIDIAVDFMDMTSNGRLWACRADVRDGLDVSIGNHVVVGDDGADLKVARILTADDDGRVELEVLRGAIDEHRSLLAKA